ncbi:VOC family protein [Nocardioides jensenii]|uniref:VOC family protein n=1 Tax=Nocardioides jensenii TaxID=1843 RepID=UPI00082C97C8|nr:VOC family protein [Nocardioides jensenii]
MTSIDTITLEVADPAAATDFYDAAFGLAGPDSLLRLRAGDAATSGFRGCTLSLITSQPADVDALAETAIEAGATVLKPVAKSFWGYGGVLRAPDGTIWQVASSSKKNTGPATREIDSVVLLIGADDVLASKGFYEQQGLKVAKSFGRKYVEFEAGTGRVTLALNGRKALAKVAGVDAVGEGSHRIAIGTSAGAFTDPDGFAWEPSTADAPNDHLG